MESKSSLNPPNPEIVISREDEQEYHESILTTLVHNRNCPRLMLTNLLSNFGLLMLAFVVLDGLLSALAWLLTTGETFYLDETHFPTQWLNPCLFAVHYVILILGAIGFVLNSRFCLLIYCLSLLIQCNFLLFDMFVRFDLLICSCFACKSIAFVLTVLAHLRLDNRRIVLANIMAKQQEWDCRMKLEHRQQDDEKKKQFVTNDTLKVPIARRGSA